MDMQMYPKIQSYRDIIQATFFCYAALLGLQDSCLARVDRLSRCACLHSERRVYFTEGGLSLEAQTLIERCTVLSYRARLRIQVYVR